MDQITLKNFRCFREEQTAKLAPLTLLVGENSTGKTSFMAMIRALWDVIYGNAPDFKETPYDLGSFDEIVHNRGKSGQADEFEAGFYVHKEAERTANSGQPYHFEVTFVRNGTEPSPVKRRLAHGDVWIENSVTEDLPRQLRFGTDKDTWQQDPIDNDLGGFVNLDRLLPFYHILLFFKFRESVTHISSNISEQPTKDVLNQVEQLLEIFEEPRSFGSQRPHASAPVRSKPRRTYDTSRFAWEPEGDYIPVYLANLHFQNEREWEFLRQKLENFGQAAGLFDEISVKSLGKKESSPFQVQIRKFGSQAKGPHRNLIDVGYGVSQVLPVIIELLQKDTSLFLLQQPEVHLHPSAQAALGTFFCDIAQPDRQLVVETHSDHLLDRVRMEIRDGTTRLKPDDVSILFFERDNLDVRIHSLRLDKQGNVLDAPQSYRNFFMEETRRSLGL